MKKRLSVHIHPAGAALLVILLFFAPSAEVMAGMAALLWHEAAHVTVMLLCGIPKCRVELTPFGGMADAENFDRLSCIRQALSAAAGVLASAAGAWAIGRCGLDGPFWEMSRRMNLSLAMINSMPVWPLDGARVCLAMARRLGWERGAIRVMKALSWLLAGMMIALGLYGAWHGYINLSLFVIGPYLCYAAQQGSVSESVRRMKRSGRQLEESPAVPVFLAACKAGETAAARRMLAPRFGSGQYCMLAQIHPVTHRVERLWTEQELMQTFLNEHMEGTDMESGVDKAHCL